MKSDRFFMTGLVIIGLLLLVGLVLPGSGALAYTEKLQSRFESSEVLIKVKRETRSRVREGRPEESGLASVQKIHQKYRIKSFERVARMGKNSDPEAELFGWYKVTLDLPKEMIPGGLNKAIGAIKSDIRGAKVLQEIIQQLRQDPDIEAVDLNYQVVALVVPNDPYYSSSGSWGQSYPDLWGIKKINSASAWDQTVGSASIVVADIDTGVDRNHPDLAGNIWVNTRETPGNGIDDDRNGYVDDYYGWDWANRDSDPMDDHGHGTHTVGTIAAVGNNALGVVGVNWTVKIMALKFLSAGGSGTLDDGIRALQYAADMGARVSSNSWGCNCTSAAMDDAVQYEHDRGMVMVAAAGNSNSDAIDFSPADADYAITAAASDPNDARASFSNWGEKIDVAAPGVDVLSLRAAGTDIYRDGNHFVPVGDPNARYYRASGTSMACPHVAGLAALVLAKNPSLTNEEVRQIIRLGADDLGTVGKDPSYGYGRINANGSMALAAARRLAPIITSPRSRTLLAGTTVQITGSVPGPNFSSYKVEIGNGRQPTSWTPLANSTTQVINGLLATVNSATLPEGFNIIRLTAFDTLGKAYQFQVHDVEVDNMDVAISSPLGLVAVSNQTGVFGTALTKNGLPFDHYKLEWGVGTAPPSWSTAGITLANGGTQPVNNGLLGTWDTTTLTLNQTYTLRLTVYSATSSGVASVTVTPDQDLVAGWPKAIPRGPDPAAFYGGPRCAPVIADMDGDGSKEIIIASANQVFVFRRDGSNFPGFPATYPSSTLFFDGRTIVDDLDKDGRKEIVVGSSDFTTITNFLHIYRSDGTPYPGWPKRVGGALGMAWQAQSPAIADLDGDGLKEIVMLDGWSYLMHAFHPNGTAVTGFPYYFYDPNLTGGGWMITSPAIVDLDRDGKPEIAFGYANKLYLIDNQGKLLQGWPYIAADRTTTAGPVPQYFKSAPASGDLNGDGKLEVVAFAQAQNCIGCGASWHVLNKGGTSVPPFPAVPPGADATGSGVGPGYIWDSNDTEHPPALADMNGDGKDEIVGGFFDIFIYDPASAAFRKLNATATTTAAAVSDMDGDGKFEFTANGSCCPEGNPVTTIVNDDGTVYWKRLGPQFLSPMFVADLDNDGAMELVGFKWPPSDVKWDGFLYVWKVPRAGAGLARYEWPMYGHDPARTGRLVTAATPPPPPDTTPPTSSITSPVNGQTVAGVVNVTATASDNVGVTNVEFYVDGVLKGSDPTSPYTFSWDTALVSNGSHSLQAKAYDAAGNVGSSSVVTVTVSNSTDTTPPTVTLTDPTNGATVARRSKVTIRAIASDNVGVTRVEFYVNGSLLATDTASPYETVWSVPGKPRTPYTLKATAYDAAGNSASASITVSSQ